MNRKRLILGISVSVLLILIISGLVLFKQWQGRPAQVDQRFPLQRLSYCSSNQVTPCIVSFSLDSNGKMLVNFLTTGAFYPDFYLKIKQGEEQHIYSCQKVNKFATSVYCTGAALPLGEVFQFSIFSLKEDVLLAEGDFSIIGLALGTPIIASSPTLGTPSTPSPTEGILVQTPTLAQMTPTPPTSYPNYP
ncbi:MAG TPA: hypothetical protein VF918_24600 [Anaerolineales bacterium]